MVVTPTQRVRRKSPKRVAIIEAETEEFWSRGFSGASMDRIAESANVSKRTVYDSTTAYARLMRDMIAFFEAGKKEGRLKIRTALVSLFCNQVINKLLGGTTRSPIVAGGPL